MLQLSAQKQLARFLFNLDGVVWSDFEERTTRRTPRNELGGCRRKRLGNSWLHRSSQRAGQSMSHCRIPGYPPHFLVCVIDLSGEKTDVVFPVLGADIRLWTMKCGGHVVQTCSSMRPRYPRENVRRQVQKDRKNPAPHRRPGSTFTSTCWQKKDTVKTKNKSSKRPIHATVEISNRQKEMFWQRSKNISSLPPR